MRQAIPKLAKLKGWCQLAAGTTDLRQSTLDGVTVNQENGRVNKIDLAHKHLEGSIGGIRFQDLAALHVLRLGNNRLAGDLPDELGTSLLSALGGFEREQQQRSRWRAVHAAIASTKKKLNRYT